MQTSNQYANLAEDKGKYHPPERSADCSNIASMDDSSIKNHPCSKILVGLVAPGATAETGEGYTLLALGNTVGVLGLVEDETRVAEAEGDGGKDDDEALEDDEGDLVLDQFAIIPILELGNTVDASGEDEDDGGREAGKEGVETPAKVGGVARAPVAEHVVAKGHDEEEEDDDLQDQTSHGDVDAHAAVGRGGHGTAGSLEDEADDIKGDEDPVEELGLEAGELRSQEDDRLGEGDVDGRGVEDGGDGEADYDVLVKACNWGGGYLETHQSES